MIAIAVSVGIPEAAQAALPSGFAKTTVFEGLHYPTQVRFSPDGRVFVAEQRGTIQMFDGLDDPHPTLVADLRESVHSYHDRGLLSIALDPDFPSDPSLYVLYTRNSDIGGPVPKWETSNPDDPELDDCPNPPGGTQDGCVVSARLAKLDMSGPGGTAVLDGDEPAEDVLIDDWCQQFDTHSIGNMEFDKKGRLYVSGGDGANYNYPDYGQAGVNGPFNPCDDPPTPVGVAPGPAQGEGGALRSQDLLTRSDPTGLDGTVIRINRDTGAGVPANPLSKSSDPNERRIVAFGLRNPFRFALRSDSAELWIGDVGQTDWEEINRVPIKQKQPANFGWPCYEGFGKQPGWAFLGNNMCGLLYSGIKPRRDPIFAFNHFRPVNKQGHCPAIGTSAVSGVEFAPKVKKWPKRFRQALLFADYSRQCIMVMRTGKNGKPDPSKVEAFDDSPGFPVDLEIGPDRALYYVDILAGAVKRIAPGESGAPRAAVTVTPRWGELPLTVTLDATASSDPEGDELQYWWELDGDGDFNDYPTGDKPVLEHTFTEPGPVRVGVAIFESGTWQDDQATVMVYPGNTPPEPQIDDPPGSLRWSAGDQIVASGSATDEQDGDLPASSLEWDLQIVHCPAGACHIHPYSAFHGDEWDFTAPDHEYPSYLELTLKATDSEGLSATTSRRIDPRSVRTWVRSKPRGLKISAAGKIKRTPFRVRMIRNGGAVFAAPKAQKRKGTRWAFKRWKSGAKRVHNVTATKNGSAKAIYKRKKAKRNKAKNKKAKKNKRR